MTNEIAIAAIAAVPLTISSVASVVAAMRSGTAAKSGKETVRQVKRLENDLYKHLRDSQAHGRLKA